jgi:hypothetical protein
VVVQVDGRGDVTQVLFIGFYGVGAEGVEGRSQLVEGRLGVVASQPEGLAVDWVEGAIQVLLLTIV